jgi:hypothetical protein
MHEKMLKSSFSITEVLRVYFLPIIISFGIIFNSLSFFVMRRIQSTTSFYMSILNLSDSAVLLTGGLNVFLYATYKWSFMNTSIEACKIFSFLIYSILDFSVLIIVIMTAEKLYAVTRPIKAHKVKFNKKKSVKIVSLAFIFCVFMNSHFVLTHSLVDINESLKFAINGLEDYYLHQNKSLNKSALFEIEDDLSSKIELFCTYTKWNFFYDNYWPYIDATIYSFLPSTLLSIFNILIAIRMFKAKKIRTKLIERSHTACSQASSNNSIISKHKRKKSINNNDVRNNSIKCGTTAVNSKESLANSLNAKTKLIEQTIQNTIVHFNNATKSVNIEKRKSLIFEYLDNHKNLIRKSSDNTQVCFSNKKSLAEFKKMSISFLQEQDQHCKTTKTHLTITLFLINTSFCIMSCPIVILQIFHSNSENNIVSFDSENNSSDYLKHYEDELENFYNKFDIIKTIAELLQYSNHSLNFFLYCLSGETFRKETLEFLLNFRNFFNKLKNFF